MNIIVSKNVVFWRGGWCFRHVCSFIGLSWTERFVCVELCLFSLECCLYLLIYTCNSLDYIVACGKRLSVVHGACSLLPTAHRIHLNPTGLNSLLRLYIMRIDKSTLSDFAARLPLSGEDTLLVTFGGDIKAMQMERRFWFACPKVVRTRAHNWPPGRLHIDSFCNAQCLYLHLKQTAEDWRVKCVYQWEISRLIVPCTVPFAV